MISLGQKRGSRVGSNADRQCARALGCLQRCDRERRSAARGDCDHHVVCADPQLGNLGGRSLSAVFRILDWAQQCRLAARHDKGHAIRRPPECRQEFRTVLNGDPRRGSGACIDQSSAALQALRPGIHRRSQRAQRRPDRGDGRHLPGVQFLQRRPCVP